MPKKLERCVASVRKSGKAKGAAYAICNASMNKKKKAMAKKKKAMRKKMSGRR